MCSIFSPLKKFSPDNWLAVLIFYRLDGSGLRACLIMASVRNRIFPTIFGEISTKEISFQLFIITFLQMLVKKWKLSLVIHKAKRVLEFASGNKIYPKPLDGLSCNFQDIFVIISTYMCTSTYTAFSKLLLTDWKYWTHILGASAPQLLNRLS